MILSHGFKFELEKISPQPGDLIFIKIISPDWALPSESQMESWKDIFSKLNVNAEFIIYCDGVIEKIKTVRTIGEILPHVINTNK